MAVITVINETELGKHQSTFDFIKHHIGTFNKMCQCKSAISWLCNAYHTKAVTWEQYSKLNDILQVQIYTIGYNEITKMHNEFKENTDNLLKFIPNHGSNN